MTLENLANYIGEKKKGYTSQWLSISNIRKKLSSFACIREEKFEKKLNDICWGMNGSFLFYCSITCLLKCIIIIFECLLYLSHLFLIAEVSTEEPSTFGSLQEIEFCSKLVRSQEAGVSEWISKYTNLSHFLLKRIHLKNQEAR